MMFGMFGRFLKFYTDFAAEVLRTYYHKAAVNSSA